MIKQQRLNPIGIKEKKQQLWVAVFNVAMEITKSFKAAKERADFIVKDVG